MEGVLASRRLAVVSFPGKGLLGPRFWPPPQGGQLAGP